ncbi:MAG: HAMP domain-containing histidine kinase [Dysgonamonadaceae bacterium]|jgi:two-component system phosphate regulon sensor histidine kinase PhoR|nr:HAMP domain-containing histidine kinase [Dysgonamonadaceae bacterium]
MKYSLFNIIFAISLACLFALQGIWLYYTYQGENVKIQNVLNKLLFNAIEQEMDSRFSCIEAKQTDEPTGPFDLAYEYIYDETKGNIISQQFNFIQQILFHEKIFFNLAKVDSIYTVFLHENNILIQYRLNYTDSLGNIIETTGANINKGLNLNAIPIVNGNIVTATVKIPPPTIFKSMLGVLIVSILIFLFTIACLLYEINAFLTQHHLDKLRKNLVQTLSHDMKTPLATIRSVLEQLNNGSLDSRPEMKSKFNAIATEQTLNLQTTVNQLLTTALIDQKRLILNKQETDLSQLIHSLVEEFMVRKEKNIEFSEKYDLKNTVIYANPFYLGSAISNLIDNAIKYSENAVKIDIECIAGDKQISIHIKDNGFGISKKDQQKIFNPFERGAEIQRKRINGFGLGLHNVKYLIEAHGGTVALISQEGVGSEFIITIPT